MLLQFVSFDLEQPHTSGQPYDFVDVYNGKDKNSPRIGRYSGNDTIPPVKSAGPLYIYFVTDSDVTAKGFVFKATALNFQSKSKCSNEICRTSMLSDVKDYISKAQLCIT